MNYKAINDLDIAFKNMEGFQKYIVNFLLFKYSRPRWLSWIRVRVVTRRLRVQPPPGRQHSFEEIDHEKFSTIILSLPLIQEGQLSVSGERRCTILVNRLVD